MCWKRARLLRSNIFERASAFKKNKNNNTKKMTSRDFTFYNLVSRDPKIIISTQWKSALIDQKYLRKKDSSLDRSKVLKEKVQQS